MSAAIRRHGMLLMAGGAVAGVALPDLAAAMRPWLLWISLAVMSLALLRVEPAAFGAVLRRPMVAILLLVWLTFGVPLLVFALLSPILPADSPYLAAAVLIAATPSVMSAAVFALLLGADAALLTVVALPSNAFAPVWLPLTAEMMGVAAQVDPWAMAQRLALLVFGSFGLAALAIRLAGRATLRAKAPVIDTWIVILVTLSAPPCMDGVGPALLHRPLDFAGMLGFVLVLNLALQALGYLVFIAAPVAAALSAGLVTGTRNMVLLLAAIGSPQGSDLGLIVAAAQLSLFVMPVIVAPAYRAIRARRMA
jgi:BASS family bile acid:Na+ symporter